MRTPARLLTLLLLVGAAAARAGAAAGTAAEVDWSTAGWDPAAPWRTLAVPGYRLHYPEPAEAWARHLAARLPAIRAGVAREVGWDAGDVVDVVLTDPIAQPNGAAFPLLGKPRLVLLLTPPGASSQLADFADWPTLLVTHEQAHLSHLLRPSRQPLLRGLGLPFGPIPLRAPRWVVEGYATLVEGKLTGAGRPASALRAAVLRRWAARGMLPGYAALSSGNDRYLGGAMAYLAGSAFLDWLERREEKQSGPGSLGRLWRRLTARQARSFDDAFRGVYGESPAALWGRFTAELTWQAVEVEHRLAGALREGDPWLERSWGTGAPAISRDGARLVVALGSRDRPPRLAVYATTDDAAAAQRAEEARQRARARDPEDVAAVQRGAPKRTPLATLELPGTTVAPAPRFLADGSVLFARSLPDARGAFHADLFRWWAAQSAAGGDERVARLTREADLRDADPAPDGTWAVAVESRWGATRLVRVDLGSGAVTPLTAASVEVVVDAPRLAPDGTRLAYLRHREAGWELVVRELAGGGEQVVATPPGAALQDPAWSAAGDAIFAVVGEGGLLEVEELAVGSATNATTVAPTARAPVVRPAGAAMAATPAPDGKTLFFLALEPEGLQVRRLALSSPPLQPVDLASAGLAPALPPPPAVPPASLPLAEVPASQSYGGGRGEWSLLGGGSGGAAGSSFELGARGGDLVGRWDLLAVGALGWRGGGRGAALAAAWRGWPVELSAQGFGLREEPSRQGRRVAPVGAGTATAFDLDSRGAEVSAGWRRATLGGGWALRLAAGAERLSRPRGADLTRRSAMLSARGRDELRHGRWRLGGTLALDWQRGTTAGEGWSRRGGRFDLDLAGSGGGLELSLERQREAGMPTLLDSLRVGGMPSTLLPPLAAGNRVYEPGLPSASLVGTDYEGQRVVLTMPGLPLRPFYARHRVAAAGGWRDWLALAGLELDLALPPLSLLELPAARLQVGAAYVLDEPYLHDVNGWVGISWRP